MSSSPGARNGCTGDYFRPYITPANLPIPDAPQDDLPALRPTSNKLPGSRLSPPRTIGARCLRRLRSQGSDQGGMFSRRAFEETAQAMYHKNPQEPTSPALRVQGLGSFRPARCSRQAAYLSLRVRGKSEPAEHARAIESYHVCEASHSLLPTSP